MKKHVFLVILAALSISGCASSMKDYPKYDQVLVYERPYDYTYLRTLEALNTFPGWVLEETDKVKGLIVLRNTQYGNLFDRDKWVARFRVKSLGRKKTSVELEPVSQQLTEGGKLLDRIDQMMAMTQKVQGEQSAQLVS
ncbi:MAG: hypothetical protein HY584_04980 [Candidatus Omnitrophica bacterium]|nr:hypothetical protein [Candidatus Omnitrophota bacterium]